MSVLIKGMKKPKNCYDCPLHYGHADCSYAEVREHGSVLETICPMVELPDHGDLIDRDALKSDLGINDFDCEKCGWDGAFCCSRGDGFDDACFYIENAPVIIPAERSEGG